MKTMIVSFVAALALAAGAAAAPPPSQCGPSCTGGGYPPYACTRDLSQAGAYYQGWVCLPTATGYGWVWYG